MASLTPPHRLNSPRWKNRRVGLFGGTFNPPHAGHFRLAKVALQRLNLDAVWWLVTPQNPLKNEKPPSLEARMALCESIATHPRMFVTDIEKSLDTQTSFATVQALQKHFSQTHFIWLTGMDCAQELHHWHRWRDLLGHISIAHIARPPATSLVKASPARLQATQKHRFKGRDFKVGESYWFLDTPLYPLSSTTLRAR